MTYAREKDYAARVPSFLLLWGIPIAVLFAVNFTEGLVPLAARILVTSAMMAWMGAACVINAYRCRRLHCFIAGPALLLGAAGVLLTGFEMVDLGRDGPTYFIWTSFAMVLLSLLLERLIGKSAPPA